MASALGPRVRRASVQMEAIRLWQSSLDLEIIPDNFLDTRHWVGLISVVEYGFAEVLDGRTFIDLCVRLMVAGLL